MSDVDFLIQKRGHTRTQITKLHLKVTEQLANLSRLDRSTCLNKFERLDNEIQQQNRDIGALLWARDKTEVSNNKEMKECEEYNDKICLSVTALKESLIVADIAATVQTVTAAANPNLMLNKFKLPEIPLPTFSNAKDESLNHFLVSFETIIDKYNLTSHEKFVFLKRQLFGEPLTVIKSLSAASQSFECAKTLLEEAFATKTTQRFDVIKRLSELKLGSDAYEFISEMRLITELIKSLNIGIETVLQYFIWNAMNTTFQNQLVNICNSNKPSLQEINENIFKALDRYKDINAAIKNRRSNNNNYRSSSDVDGVSAMATNVNFGGKTFGSKSRFFCSMCSVDGHRESSHSTRDCTKYTTPDEKCKQLEKLSACSKCGYANHKTNSCSFKFAKTCFQCGGNHMTFLCNNSQQKNSSENTKKEQVTNPKQVTAGIIWTNVVYQVRVGNNTILPTFTCSICASGDIHAMKDTGCQANFILAELAETYNLNVIEKNVPIMINGFNESRRQLTNVVEVPLKIAGKVNLVQALCVPEIKVKLSLPELPVICQKFISNGYKLADKALYSCPVEISDFGFILGSHDPQVLLEQQVAFGNGVMSVYSNTQAGVLLQGDTDSILDNIEYLNKLHTNISNDCSVPDLPLYSQSNNTERHPLIEEEVTLDNIVTNFAAISDRGQVNNEVLLEATAEMLNKQCEDLLQYDQVMHPEDSTEVNNRLVQFALSNTTRNSEGRLLMPLLWRSEVSHLLGSNFHLAKKILESNLKKVSKNEENLMMIDKVFKDQEQQGIITKIEDVKSYMAEHPEHSFLAHMPVFRKDHASTKCRVVFLSNLGDNANGSKPTLSHNRVMHAGPSLNQKITTAIWHLRFGEKLLCFDLKKAFLQIALSDLDSNKLLFLWFRDVSKKDFSLIAYKNMRLSFGLRSSPTILMLAMYKILCLDVIEDSEEIQLFKRMLYALIYMDNGAFSGSSEQLQWAYERLPEVFSPYRFELQQMVTNDESLQTIIDDKTEEKTPESVKLLGLQWNRVTDSLSCRALNLDCNANTKRTVLRSIASQYDVFGLLGPCLNRARLFMHGLQCDKSIGWDTVLDESALKTWKNIARQANNSGNVEIDRNVGDRDDNYRLVCFSDASKTIYSSVLYLHNLTSGKVSFLSGKNRIVNRQMETKTIPTLELQAITLGVEALMEAHEELSRPKCVFPLRVKDLELYTDSSISLHWLNSYNYKMDKMRQHSVFVMNRLEFISRQCDKFPITFNFVGTLENPADCLTRTLSYKQLIKSTYLKGPSFLREEKSNESFADELRVLIPNPVAVIPDNSPIEVISRVVSSHVAPVIPIEKFSSFRRLVRVNMYVIKFINCLKLKVKRKNTVKFDHIETLHDSNLYASAFNAVLKCDQHEFFPDIFDFLLSSDRKKKDIPPLVSRLNLFVDTDGLLKVKSKFDRWSNKPKFAFPVLLSKDSSVARLIIDHIHFTYAHAGCYSVLTHLRKQYWIPSFFSTVKRVLKSCVHCKRVNSRPVKLNQSSYRDFRANPPCEPYQYVFIDYLGPYTVKLGSNTKMWILCFSCLWSRSINLIICPDLTVKSFLRAFQEHVFEHGLPCRVFSDLGSQLVAGGNIVTDFLNDADTTLYLQEHGITFSGFHQYFKGNSELGSLVEVCVKFTKRLIFGAIRNMVLNFFDFQLLIIQTVHLVNKRPIAFQEALREGCLVDVPSPITPELLTKGRELTAVGVIPALQGAPDADPDWQQRDSAMGVMRKEFSKLRKAKESLVSIYNSEFMQNLISQAVDKPNRYAPVNHERLKLGDIVLLKEPHTKCYNYPMAVVKELTVNDSDEVTGVVVMKGRTREFVKRHVSAVIPLLSPCVVETEGTDKAAVVVPAGKGRARRKRRAAEQSRVKTAAMLHDG